MSSIRSFVMTGQRERLSPRSQAPAWTALVCWQTKPEEGSLTAQILFRSGTMSQIHRLTPSTHPRRGRGAPTLAAGHGMAGTGSGVARRTAERRRTQTRSRRGDSCANSRAQCVDRAGTASRARQPREPLLAGGAAKWKSRGRTPRRSSQMSDFHRLTPSMLLFY